MSVTDAELREGLEATLGRPVGEITRRPWAYSSSATIEELSVAGCPPLLFKDLLTGSRTAPGFVVDPWRELEVYRLLLGGLDAPALVGALAGPGRAWLFVERLDAIPLWQAAGDEAWLAAARWLARMHSAPAPAPAVAGRLLIRDGAHLDRWVQRATAADASGALGEIQVSAREAIARLAAWPVSLLHGEFYPSNVLVQELPGQPPRIRVIDWEMAGIGPGVLDLAALIAGKHDPDLRRRIIEAYRAELAYEPEDFHGSLRAARMLVALQWIGWEPDWTPPAEHAHDWQSDAVAMAGGEHR